MQKLLSLGLGLGVALSTMSTALAVQPAPVQRDSKVAWSRIINDPFDGMVVYDKNFDPKEHGFTFVSSWSKDGIRATYTEFEAILQGYRTVWKTRRIERKKGKVEYEHYPEQEPIYRYNRIDRTPKAMLFAVGGKVYRYESGPVGPELAAALTSAPAENMRIRLIWDTDETMDTVIGKDTVAAWKTIFKLDSISQTNPATTVPTAPMP